MILQRLMEYEQRHNDMAPIGYALRTVHYAIRLRSDGTFLDIIPLAGVESKTGKSGKSMLVPSGKRSGTCPPAFLLVDDARYVIGISGFDDYHQRFVALVRKCAEATHQPMVHAVAKWLETGESVPKQSSDLITQTDVIGFEVDGYWITELPEVREFWAEISTLATASRAGGVKARCLITGKLEEPVRILPFKIRGVPNTNQGQADFTSFNEPSFRSYGLEQTQNSPMSQEAARLFVNGLNRLLRDPLTRLYVQDAVYCFWSRYPCEFNILSYLEDPTPESVAELLRSATTGHEVSANDTNIRSADFYVLALSGNMSRIVVRDYHETTLDAVQANLARWFQQLAIVGPDGGDARPPGIFRLAASLFREAKDMPAHVPTALLNAAVNGAPLPDYLLGLAVKRNLAMQGPYAVFNKQRYLSVERLAIIKALLCKGKEIDLKGLNPQHPDAAYHCGRLLAVLERIQRAALGDINATVVDRYYGAACSSPGSILGNLVNDAQSHLGRLRKDHKDYHHQLRLEEILSAIGEEFPKTLSLPRQGLFALGFYHQKADDRAQATAHKEKQSANDTSEGEEA